MPRESLQLVIRILISDKFVPMSIKRQQVYTELKISHQSLLFGVFFFPFSAHLKVVVWHITLGNGNLW